MPQNWWVDNRMIFVSVRLLGCRPLRHRIVSLAEGRWAWGQTNVRGQQTVSWMGVVNSTLGRVTCIFWSVTIVHFSCSFMYNCAVCNWWSAVPWAVLKLKMERFHNDEVVHLKTSYSTQLKYVTLWQQFNVCRTSWLRLDCLQLYGARDLEITWSHVWLSW